MNITGLTRGGQSWTPAFVVAVDQSTCIGCGRCYKVCPREVFELIELDDEDLDDVRSVMTLGNALDCIGCGSCSRVCPKNCHSHEAMPSAG
jgi:Nif-specific ferredoxin III